jgi:hypothetical protein
MGKVIISDTKGKILEQSNFGADVVSFIHDSYEEPRLDEYKNDGEINDLELADGRIQLEKTINEHTIGSGGPLGLGGLGGKEELFLQAWRIKGTDKAETPDGFSMPLQVRFEEEYFKPGLIFRDRETVTREVTMTLRWERGRVRLYQGAMPYYQPLESPPPSIPGELKTPKTPEPPMVASIQTFFLGPLSSAWTQLSRIFFA